ncbi:MaoC family dehydratase [Jiangella asiatica]|uniref:MaoC family dehydratase n=1 Tax=Jiangella asiatica TaxID=2530372 RepID=A0A4R5DF83_9ACTN|nr:MaoC family dehydratase [Jiangella asiatica]TDE09295.1 MaoC family dehydratase [Jiangella asiatica]
MTTIDLSSVDVLAGLAGVEHGPTGWLTLTQDRIDTFAAITEDRQWIHVDPVRAAAGPFGGTIGHGYFTLSLVAHWIYELFPLPDGVTSINYGLNKVRFPAPVPVGSRLRMTATVQSFTPFDDGADAVIRCVIELAGAPKPACVAEPVLRLVRAV